MPTPSRRETPRATTRVEGGGKRTAEGVGFEPTKRIVLYRFSRPAPSATRRALPGRETTGFATVPSVPRHAE